MQVVARYIQLRDPHTAETWNCSKLKHSLPRSLRIVYISNVNQQSGYTSKEEKEVSYKRVVITGFGGPEVLKVVEESELPNPKPGEVRVKVLATSAAHPGT